MEKIIEELKAILNENPGLVFYLAGFALLQSGILSEIFYSLVFKKNLYRLKDTLTNISMYAGYFAILLFWTPVIFSLYYFAHNYAVIDFGPYWMDPKSIHFWWQWGLLLIFDDFCFYLFHSTSHRLRFLWASHVNHHSSTEFNLTVGFRQSWTPFFTPPFWISLCFIGFDPLMVMTMQLSSLFFQGWLHTRAISSFGPLDLIFNSPSHHRVHHGVNSQYIDKNFGGIFIIWDKIFGTFEAEKEPVVFGLTPNIESHNPFKVAFHEWYAIFKSLLKSKSMKDISKSLFSILIVIGLTGCIDNIQISRIKNNLSKLESYSGVIKETGLTKTGDVKSEISFQKPYDFKVKILEPKKYQGISVSYYKNKLTYYYPMIKWGIVFNNLEMPTKKDLGQLVESSYKYNLNKYNYSFGASSKVASYQVIKIKHKAKKKAYNISGQTFVYDKFSFPLAGSLKFKNGSIYKYLFEKIFFNKKIAPKSFDLKIPSETFLMHWDLKKEGLSDKEVKSRSTLLTPSIAAGKLDLKKVKTIQVDEGFPTFTSIYKNGPYFLFITFFKDFTKSFDKFSYGIPIEKGHLLTSAMISSYTFKKNGLIYMMSGNIPFEEILTLSKTINLSDKAL